MAKSWRSVLPEGAHKARIHFSRRETGQLSTHTLAQTLGEEAQGMVVIDAAAGVPLQYESLAAMADLVATQHPRLDIDVRAANSSVWRNLSTPLTLDGDAALDPEVCQDIQAGVEYLGNETWVPANDPHYDAKVFPHIHPYGTGSLLSEPNAGGELRHAANRLLLLQSCFRRNAQWGFWFLSRHLRSDLFFKNKRRQSAGRKGASTADETDNMTRLFGQRQPAAIPESSEWWKLQQRNLFAITDPAERGLMQAMITVTHNDSSPEMLAAIRRGPCSAPTTAECSEYLMTRKKRGDARPDFENHSVEHVLSFQRRVHALKTKFLRRGKKTPIGRLRDFWDRTEAQLRAALHAHILTWFWRRQTPPDFVPLAEVERTIPGTVLKQRPRTQKVNPLPDGQYQEDNLYHHAEVGRITTEMARPCVAGVTFGGYDVDSLRVAGLARSVQSRFYVHNCSHKYCLKNRSRCRFFFPFPMQPQQQYDANVERVACQRRCPEDDQWMDPHNLCLAMFSPATIHVLPFDPWHGADNARQYAGKYAGKQEPWYYLETERDGVKHFLQSRTVGLCMAHNRLLGNRVVRSTVPVEYTHTSFIPPRESCTPRTPAHLKQYPQYPDPQFFLNNTGNYFFRHPDLRHLRLEQFNRYFKGYQNHQLQGGQTLENTIGDEDDIVPADIAHRHYDAFAEVQTPGSSLPSVVTGVPRAQRRQQGRLAVCRPPVLEPLAKTREAFYEQKLLLGLPWHCAELPATGDVVEWVFHWTPPAPVEVAGIMLHPRELRLARGRAMSFEKQCAEIEDIMCSPEYNLVCACCAMEDNARCPACRYAVGLHFCQNSRQIASQLYWRKGTLHAGSLDVERVVYNLYIRGLPMPKLREKAHEYVEEGLLQPDRARNLLRALEQEKQDDRVLNAVPSEGLPGESANNDLLEGAHHHLTQEELEIELARREACLQAGQGETVTDQWRVYAHVVDALQADRALRLMVQASAGTGKSFLLSTIFLWCIVNRKKAKAAAPTGIAAANIEIEGTAVGATTAHAMFGLTTELTTNIDFTKTSDPKVRALTETEVLLLDEVSMLDVDVWSMIQDLSQGIKHIILFGDFKQLPPASSRPPFIISPSVFEQFDFRVLRQNRRVVSGSGSKAAEIENFHGVLEDLSVGKASQRLMDFIVEAYVKGARCGCAALTEFEASTSVFSLRRYRDKWNREVIDRLAKQHAHSIRINGRVRAQGAMGTDWFSDRSAERARRSSRPQSSWKLRLAGDWHWSYETSYTSNSSSKRHLMRVMLLSNLNTEQRFASGTQGRVTCWSPDVVNPKKAVKASHPDITIRFTKEKSLLKKEMFPEIDFMEVMARPETLAIQGKPVLLQVPLAPSYALTVHKVQSLSMKDIVRGCLESMFAYGQLYVLVSRVTDPDNFELIGLPPADLLDAVVQAWQEAGMNVEECLQRALGVTKEFEYVPGAAALCDRIRPVFKGERTTQIRHKDFGEILIPQPRATAVYRRLLDWIDRVDTASQVPGAPRPAFLTAQGDCIFPDEEDTWWLLDRKRKATESEEKDDEDGPILEEDAVSGDDAEALVTDSSADSDEDQPADHHLFKAGRVAWARTEMQGQLATGHESVEPLTSYHHAPPKRQRVQDTPQVAADARPSTAPRTMDTPNIALCPNWFVEYFVGIQQYQQ